ELPPRRIVTLPEEVRIVTREFPDPVRPLARRTPPLPGSVLRGMSLRICSARGRPPLMTMWKLPAKSTGTSSTISPDPDCRSIVRDSGDEARPRRILPLPVLARADPATAPTAMSPDPELAVTDAAALPIRMSPAPVVAVSDPPTD